MSTVAVLLVLVHLPQIAYTLYCRLFSQAHRKVSDGCSTLPAVIVSVLKINLQQLETSSIKLNYPLPFYFVFVFLVTPTLDVDTES